MRQHMTIKPASLSPADRRKLLRPPQEDIQWQLATHAHSFNYGPPMKTPLFCSILNDQTLSLSPPGLLTYELTPKVALRLLTHAIKSPYNGLPARPTTITTSDEELFAWLKPSADKLHIELLLGPTPEADALIHSVGMIDADGALDYTTSPDYSRARFDRVFLASERLLAARHLLISFPTISDIFCIRRQDTPEATPLYALTSIGDHETSVVLVTSPDLELISQYQRIVLELDEGEIPLAKVTSVFFELVEEDSSLYTLYHPGSVKLGWSQPLTPMFHDHGELLPSAQALEELELAMLAISATFAALSQESPYNIDSDLDRPHTLNIMLDEHPDKPALHITVPVEQLPSPGLTDDFDPSLPFDQIDDIKAWSTELITRFERTLYYRRTVREVYYPVPKWCMARIIAAAMAHERASLQTLTLESLKLGVVALIHGEDYDLELDSESTTDLNYLLRFINERLQLSNDAILEDFDAVVDPTALEPTYTIQAWLDDLLANHDEQTSTFSDDELAAAIRRFNAAQRIERTPYGEIKRDTAPKPSTPKKKAKNKQQRSSRKKNRKKKK